MADAPAATAPLGRKMAAGAAWMMLFKLVDRAIGFVSVLILARLLVPADFGLVAMGTAVVALLELLNAFGFDIAIIAHRSATREHYDTAWTFNVIAGLGIGALMLVLAWPAAHFYGEPRLVGVVSALALAAAVQGWENVGVVAFRKDLDFRQDFRFLVLKRLGSVAVAIPAAFVLRNHWALVCGILAGRTLAVAASYWVHPYRPRLTLVARRDLLDFSRWMLVNNVLAFLKVRSPDFLIGRMLGAAAVGSYNMGSELANLPTLEMSAPLNRALLPGYAAAGRGGTLAQTYLSTLGTFAMFVVPAGLGLAVLAEPVVAALLGPKWTAAVPVLELMAAHGVIAALQALGYTLMLASNRPALPARLNIAHVALLLGLLVTLTVSHGLVGAAVAYLASGLVMAPVNFHFVARLLEVSLLDIAAALWRPVVAAGAMVGALLAWRGSGLVAGFGMDLLTLAVDVLVGAVVYCAGLLALWVAAGRPGGPEQKILGLVRARGLGGVR
jgi:O-antigen/teichoic acid export membrane protein